MDTKSQTKTFEYTLQIVNINIIHFLSPQDIKCLIFANKNIFKISKNVLEQYIRTILHHPFESDNPIKNFSLVCGDDVLPILYNGDHYIEIPVSLIFNIQVAGMIRIFFKKKPYLTISCLTKCLTNKEFRDEFSPFIRHIRPYDPYNPPFEFSFAYRLDETKQNVGKYCPISHHLREAINQNKDTFLFRSYLIEHNLAHSLITPASLLTSRYKTDLYFYTPCSKLNSLIENKLSPEDRLKLSVLLRFDTTWIFAKFHPIIYDNQWEKLTLDLMVKLGTCIINRLCLSVAFLYKNEINEFKFHTFELDNYDSNYDTCGPDYDTCPHIQSGKHKNISLLC